jgi:hypothetical protein
MSTTQLPPEDRSGAASQARGKPPAPARRFDRRALLLGAAGTGAGITAGLVAGAAPAQAAQANGTPVELGESNTATGTTAISTNNGYGLWASSTGHAGVRGDTTVATSSGVSGHDDSGSRKRRLQHLRRWSARSPGARSFLAQRNRDSYRDQKEAQVLSSGHRTPRAALAGQHDPGDLAVLRRRSRIRCPRPQGQVVHDSPDQVSQHRSQNRLADHRKSRLRPPRIPRPAAMEGLSSGQLVARTKTGGGAYNGPGGADSEGRLT